MRSFRVLIDRQIDCHDGAHQEEVLWQSLRLLHNMGPAHIIISSISPDKTDGNPAMLQMRASTQLAGRRALVAFASSCSIVFVRRPVSDVRNRLSPAGRLLHGHGRFVLRADLGVVSS